MRIGKNLIQYRFARGWSQAVLARETGMSQSNYSRIEFDKQNASPEQIETFALALGVPLSTLAGPGSPFYTVENQPGSHANDNFVQIGMEAVLAAKDETIAVLKEQMHFCEEQVRALEEDSHALREQLQQLISKAIEI